MHFSRKILPRTGYEHQGGGAVRQLARNLAGVGPATAGADHDGALDAEVLHEGVHKRAIDVKSCFSPALATALAMLAVPRVNVCGMCSSGIEGSSEKPCNPALSMIWMHECQKRRTQDTCCCLLRQGGPMLRLQALAPLQLCEAVQPLRSSLATHGGTAARGWRLIIAARMCDTKADACHLDARARLLAMLALCRLDT